MPSLRTATNPTKMEHRMGFNFRGSKLLRMAAFHNIHSFCFHGCRSLMYYILCMHYISVLIQTMIKLYVAGMSHFKEMRLKRSESEHSEALTEFFFANLPCFSFATVAAHLSVALSAFPLRNPYLHYLNTHCLAVEPPSPSVVCFTPAVRCSSDFTDSAIEQEQPSPARP